jgi:hypothetical protein
MKILFYNHTGQTSEFQASYHATGGFRSTQNESNNKRASKALPPDVRQVLWVRQALACRSLTNGVA